MPGLVLPRAARLRLVPSPNTPIDVSGLVAGVVCSHCSKTPYHLEPFFSDASGTFLFSRELLEIAAEACLATGIMDFGLLDQCGPQVTLEVWSEKQIRDAIEGRKLWGLLCRETTRWNSVSELTDQLEKALRARSLLHLSRASLPAIWDGSAEEFEYSLIATIR